MKRIKILTSVLTLSFALVICGGGVIGFLAALNATYNINGTVSYTADHVNATVEFEKFESAITETVERTPYDIQNATYKDQPQQTATVSFSDTTSATETKATDAAFPFSPEVVAYKVKLTITNKSNVNINVYTTAQEPSEQENWFVKIIAQQGSENIAPTDKSEVFVYVGIKDLSKNVNPTSFNIQTALEKVSFVELSYEINNQIVHTQQVQKNTSATLLNAYYKDFEEDIENGAYGQTNQLQRTTDSGEKQGVGAWLDGQDKVVDEDTVITSNMLLKPDWWFYDNSTSAWTMTENSIKATSDTKSKEKIIIPNEVDGKDVTSIREYAFSYCSALTQITIPSSVTSIGERAFYGCGSLTQITIPSSVTSIGDSAFADCTSLESVVIPDGVLSIGSHAFADCTSLKRISIPDSVELFYGAVFAGCTSLVKDGFVLGSSMSTDGKALFKTSSNIKTLISFFSNDASYQVPQGVHHIGPGAFMENNDLVSVTIPESVIVIAPMAFAICPNLNTVIIKGVPLVGFAAFFESPVNKAYIDSQPAAEWHAWVESTYSFTTVQAVSQILAMYQLLDELYVEYPITATWDVIGWPNPNDELINAFVQSMYEEFPVITGTWLPFDKLFLVFKYETNFYFKNSAVKAAYEATSFWDDISNRFYLQ